MPPSEWPYGSGRLVIVREGHGEEGAVENLVSRVGRDLDVIPRVFGSIPASQRVAISSEKSAVKAVEVATTLTPSAVLLTADCDDDCPRDLAPRLAQAVAREGFGFPVGVVLFYREYESLALSVAEHLSGKEMKSPAGQTILQLAENVATPDSPEANRDAKGHVSRLLMSGVQYKPTIHQLPLTRLLKTDQLRAAGLSSFRRLENALRFLAEQAEAGSSGTYPR